MRRARAAALLTASAVLATAVLVASPAARAKSTTSKVKCHDTYAQITPTEVVLGNAFVERRWPRDVLATTLLQDKRTGLALRDEHADFSLILDGARVGSDQLPVTDVQVEKLDPCGLRLHFSLLAPELVEIDRTVAIYPHVAVFRSQTTITSLVPVALSGYTLDEAAAGTSPSATIHAFRAGADWRDSGWSPGVSVGDPHTGDWHVQTSAPPGDALEGPGEWLSMAYPGGQRLFMVMERRDYASSRMSYDGTVTSATVDLSRDLAYAGPFEENVHAENPSSEPVSGRYRGLVPGRPLALEPVVTGFGFDADDEPWQHYQALVREMPPYPRAITFNTNDVDRNLRSTGSKDDVDYERFLSLLAAAREMGVETFVFDDGWQGISGDWCPDSPACPDPRWDGSASSKFRPRFPDSSFAAVQQQLHGDPSTASDDVRLGLWMSPMAFHPSSTAYRASPEWGCTPAGQGTGALSVADPNGGSEEAGIGLWDPEATGIDPDTGQPEKLISYIEGRIRRAIDVYGATYFKFDFLVWVDCLGVSPADMYDYHDSFVAMLDRLERSYPTVTFEIDETNDYRLFPFESVARGPSWFQNGTPRSTVLLHNLWNLAPYVPGFAIGQHALGNAQDVTDRGVDYLMSVALGSHITFWTEIDSALTADQRAEVKKWTDLYKRYRSELATFTYPLLDDPSTGGWTGLQPWDPDAGRGFLLAYRQEAPNPTQVIPLRGVPAGRAFSLTAIDPATGTSTPLGTFSSDQLRAGVPITIAQPYGYAIIRIAPA